MGGNNHPAMRKPLLLSLSVLSALAWFAGCHSRSTAKQRYQDTPGSFADQSARDAYVDARVAELTKKGVSPGDAAARASREWFTQAPTSSETPTRAERERRAAQADFEEALNKRKKDAEGN